MGIEDGVASDAVHDGFQALFVLAQISSEELATTSNRVTLPPIPALFVPRPVLASLPTSLSNFGAMAKAPRRAPTPVVHMPMGRRIMLNQNSYSQATPVPSAPAESMGSPVRPFVRPLVQPLSPYFPALQMSPSRAEIENPLLPPLVNRMSPVLSQNGVEPRAPMENSRSEFDFAADQFRLLKQPRPKQRKSYKVSSNALFFVLPPPVGTGGAFVTRQRARMYCEACLIQGGFFFCFVLIF